MSLNYFLILQQNNIVIESSKAPLNVLKIVSSISENANQKCGYYGTYHNMRFYYEYDELLYIVAVDEKVPLRILVSFLSFTKRDFSEKFIIGKQKLNRSKYRNFLNNHLDTLIQEDRLINVSQEVDETTNLMAQNIQKAVFRGEELNKLQEQTELLEDNARDFAKDSEKLRHGQCLKYYCCCFVSCCKCCI